MKDKNKGKKRKTERKENKKKFKRWIKFALLPASCQTQLKSTEYMWL
jgi:hypothetical protein